MIDEIIKEWNMMKKQSEFVARLVNAFDSYLYVANNKGKKELEYATVNARLLLEEYYKEVHRD